MIPHQSGELEVVISALCRQGLEPADDREENGLYPTACGSRGSWDILYLIRGGRIFLKVGFSGHSKSPKQGLLWRADRQEPHCCRMLFRNRI